MFLHGSWMHLLGELWFLWLFGNNVEDAMGRVRFVVFYLISEVSAAVKIFNLTKGRASYFRNALSAAVLRCSGVAHSAGNCLALVILESSSRYCSDRPSCFMRSSIA
jgi:membrane associated rhomboid family serine protease